MAAGGTQQWTTVRFQHLSQCCGMCASWLMTARALIGTLENMGSFVKPAMRSPPVPRGAVLYTFRSCMPPLCSCFFMSCSVSLPCCTLNHLLFSV